MLITVTPATTEPVTLPEAKAHLRLTHTADDVLVSSMISAAREVVEQNTGRALAAAGYRWAAGAGKRSPVRLPLWAASEITEVSYLDSDGVRVVMAPQDYTFDADRNTLTLDKTCGLNVSFDVAPQNVPAALKSAILLLVGDLYENAEASIVGTIVNANPAVMNLIFPHRLNLGP